MCWQGKSSVLLYIISVHCPTRRQSPSVLMLKTIFIFRTWTPRVQLSKFFIFLHLEIIFKWKSMKNAYLIHWCDSASQFWTKMPIVHIPNQFSIKSNCNLHFNCCIIGMYLGSWNLIIKSSKQGNTLDLSYSFVRFKSDSEMKVFFFSILKHENIFQWLKINVFKAHNWKLFPNLIFPLF